MDECEDYAIAEANSGRDRLSELPDSLIHEILSLLEIRDVVRTNILSKRWKSLWSTIPCLDFCKSERFLGFQSIVSSVLSQWKGSKILKFRLSFPIRIVDSCSVIDSWLLFAIEKQVEELFLVDSNTHEKVCYCLPQPLYSCSSITKLTLEDCKLRIEDNVQWNQLKRLELKFVDGLDGDAMNKILSGASRLEELVLNGPKLGENENFNIRSTSLRMLDIDSLSHWPETAVLRIWAPNLLTLAIIASFDGTCL